MPISAAAFSDTPEDEDQKVAPPQESERDTQDATEEAKPKRSRRTRKQMVAEAVVPSADDTVQVKLTQSGEIVDRPWLVAVELFREKRAEFKDKSLKHAVEKMDQQKAVTQDAGVLNEPSDETAAGDPDDGADAGVGGEGTHNNQELVAALEHRWSSLQERIDETKSSDTEQLSALAEEAEMVRQEIIQHGGVDPESDEGYDKRAGEAVAEGVDTGLNSGKKTPDSVPPEAEVGDEVILGSETYRVGHGPMLVQGQVGTPEGDVIHPKRRWRHVLGSGGKEWESEAVTTRSRAKADAPDDVITTPAVKERAAKVGVQVERTQVGDGIQHSGFMPDGSPIYKVTMGYREKIGLPDYSNLEIGPASAQRYAIDDGRRTDVTIHGRDVSIPTAAVEAMQECAQISEYVMRAERQAMINFLEAVKPGSTKAA